MFQNNKRIFELNEDITQLNYYDTIKEIRNVLDDWLPLFPLDCCEEASHMIYRVCFKKYGLHEVGGYYSKKRWHSWNYDSINKLYIDISINQFSKDFLDVFITPKKNSSDILMEDSNINQEHTKQVLTARFQERMDWLIKKFIEQYPEKEDQIIMR